MAKGDVVALIAQRLGFEAPQMSRGSTEPRTLFEAIGTALSLRLSTHTKQGMAREIVERAGARWDARYESAGATVTLQGLLAVAEAVDVLAPGQQRDRQTRPESEPTWEHVMATSPGWAGAAAIATPPERALIEAIAPLAVYGVEAPTVGEEVLDGLPMSIAWPARKVAVRWDGLDDAAIGILVGAGWAIVEPNATAIRHAL